MPRSRSRSMRTSLTTTKQSAGKKNPNTLHSKWPRRTQFLFRPKRYKVLHGGRGSAKSWSAARALLYLATKKKLRILCARETQTSITESVHRLLRDQIEAMGLSKIFDVQKALIRCRNGSEVIFIGIKTDPAKLKS